MNHGLIFDNSLTYYKFSHMIFIYSINEKQLIQKNIQGKLKNAQVEESFVLAISQHYISWLGPWFPASVKKSRLYTIQGKEILKADWSDLIKNEAEVLKEAVPFQIGFFRNTIIFLIAIAVLSVVMPKINAKKSAEAATRKETLYNRLRQLKQGDILRVSFINTADEQSINGIGLVKVMKIEGDSIFIVRSNTLVEDNMDNRQSELSIGNFGASQERVIKHLMEEIVQEDVLIAYPKDMQRANYTIGRVIKFEN